MKTKNIIKTLICMLAFAAMPVTASAFAEEVSVAEEPAIVYEESVTTIATTTAVETYIATTTQATTSNTESETTTTSGTDVSGTTTTADSESTTTTDAIATTTFDPNRIAVEDVQLNATEADVAAGKTFQIKASKMPLNATDNLAVRYISSDESIATVDSNGVVTAHKPGKVTITVIADSMIPIIQDKTMESYTVLVLDNSTSMRGEPMDAQKEAAIKFCSDALSSNTGTDYKFSILAFGSSIQLASEFTNDLSKLTDTINSINLTGATNYIVAIDKAAELLSSVGQNVVKNIVFCSDGLPNTGSTSSTGPFTSSDHSSYRYANAAVERTNELKKEGINIYTLGFFHSLGSSSRNYADTLMKDMASAPDMSYIVDDPQKLSGVFAEVANSVVNYNRIGTFKKAVEVEVTPAKAQAATVKKAEVKKTASSDQDSPKTGDNNHNTMLISILFIGIATATVAGKSRRTDK